MSLLDIRLLHESVEDDNADDVIKINDIPENAHDSSTPNTKIDNNYPSPEPCDPVTGYIDDGIEETLTQLRPGVHVTRLWCPGNIEQLEDTINSEYEELSDVYTESFYLLNRDIMLANSLLESMSIDAINKQYSILQECSYGSDEYKSRVSTLMESVEGSFWSKFADSIIKIINGIKDLLAKLGIKISIHFVNYEKWVSAKSDDLMTKAKSCGNQVSINSNKWNRDLIMEPINFNKIHSIADDFVKKTTDKDKMEKILEKVTSKYENLNDLYVDVYCKAIDEAVDGLSNKHLVSKETAREAFKLKMTSSKEIIYMNEKQTAKNISNLSTITRDTSKAISSMRSTLENNEFSDMLEETKALMNKKEESNPDGKKCRYYRCRFGVLTAIQEACNDIYKIKVNLMKEYARDLYNQLKTLDSYKEEVNNESVDINTINRPIIGMTLHE